MFNLINTIIRLVLNRATTTKNCKPTLAIAVKIEKQRMGITNPFSASLLSVEANLSNHYYLSAIPANLYITVATSARVALFAGAKLPSGMPEIIPARTIIATASSA